jgi:hypothetical protein
MHNGSTDTLQFGQSCSAGPREHGYKFALSRNSVTKSCIAEVAGPVVCRAGQIEMSVSSSPKLSGPSKQAAKKHKPVLALQTGWMPHTNGPEGFAVMGLLNKS